MKRWLWTGAQASLVAGDVAVGDAALPSEPVAVSSGTATVSSVGVFSALGTAVIPLGNAAVPSYGVSPALENAAASSGVVTGSRGIVAGYWCGPAVKS